jgi:hypothetical protein
MLRILLAKDLRRAWRNPVPWLVNLALPLCITALIGLAFGRSDETAELGRVRFAVVDEDQSPLTGFLQGAAAREDVARHLDPVFLDRQTAMRQINDNEISAVVIIPKHFTHDYLAGRERVTLELIKNPAQSIHPAVLEELLGTLVTGMNAVSRNFHSDFPEWAAAFEGQGDLHKILGLVERAGNRVEIARAYVSSPLVGYDKEVRAANPKRGVAFNLFGYLLIGMSGMFLLFLAGTGMLDLQRELRIRTFERYRTLHRRLLPFLLGKVVFTAVLVLFGSAVMLIGGGLIFRIHWQQPLALAALAFGYACCAAAVMALLAAVVRDERQVNTFNYIVAMSLAIPGGCMFPSRQLPGFMRHYITPLLPTAWFNDTARALEYDPASHAWIFVSLRLLVLSAVLITAAAVLLQRRFEAGRRA